MDTTGKEFMAAQFWRAVLELWAARDREEFIGLDELVDAVAERFGMSDETKNDDVVAYCARGGIELVIKGRAWFGPRATSAAVQRALDRGELYGNYSPQIQDRYLVTREGREGYVRPADLTDNERAAIQAALRAEANAASRESAALAAWTAERTIH
jgi:hypothetical protein